MIPSLKHELDKLIRLFPLKKIRKVELVIARDYIDAYVCPLSFDPFTPLEYKIILPKGNTDNIIGVLVHEYFHIFLGDRYDLCFVIISRCSDKEEDLFRNPLFKAIARLASDFVVDYYASKLYPSYREYLKYRLFKNLTLIKTIGESLSRKPDKYQQEMVINIVSIAIYNLMIIEILRKFLLMENQVVKEIQEISVEVLTRYIKANQNRVKKIRNILHELSRTGLSIADKDPLRAFEFVLKVLTEYFFGIHVQLGAMKVLDPQTSEVLEIKCIKLVD